MIGYTFYNYKWYIDTDGSIVMSCKGVDRYLHKEDLINMLKEIEKHETKETPKQQ